MSVVLANAGTHNPEWLLRGEMVQQAIGTTRIIGVAGYGSPRSRRVRGDDVARTSSDGAPSE